METSWRKNYLRYKSFFLNVLTQYKERSDWKAYLEILLSLATISIFSIFALKPTILTIAELIGQIEEKKETLAKMNTKIQNLSKAQTLYDREKQNIDLLIETTIPKTPNPDIFARQIEALSSKHQITVSSFSLGEATIIGTVAPPADSSADIGAENALPPNTSSLLHFSVTTNVPVAQYQQVVDFLRDFENLRMPPKTNTLQLSISEEIDTSDKKLILLVEGDLPYLPTK